MSGNIAILKQNGILVDPSVDFNLNDIYEIIEIHEDGYLFSPGEYLLVELAEKLNIPKNLVAHIRPRTRFTRAGILIADQHCNPTYEGRLFIGLHNVGPNTVLLSPGLRIAQFLFEELSSIPSETLFYKNKEDAAFYQETSFQGAKFDKKNWTEREKELYIKVMSSFNKEEK